MPAGWAAAITAGAGLLSGALGTSTSSTGNISGTQDTAQLTGSQQGMSSQIVDLMRSITDTMSNKMGQTVNVGGTKQKNAGEQTINETTSSDAESIDTSRAIIGTANKNAANAKSMTEGVVQDSLRKAAIAFGPTAVQANQTGAYGSTSLETLRGNAEASAASDAASMVLNYQMGQQKIASDATQNLLAATKTTKGGTTNSSTAAGDTTQQGLTAEAGQTTTGTTSLENKQVASLMNAVTGMLTNAKTEQVSQQSSHTGMSVICTELHMQGKMEKRDWISGMRAFNSYSDLSRKGYYAWATPACGYIQKHPTSLLTSLLQRMFVARAQKKLWAKFVVALPCFLCGTVIGFGWRQDLLLAHFSHRPRKWYRRFTKQECM